MSFWVCPRSLLIWFVSFFQRILTEYNFLVTHYELEEFILLQWVFFSFYILQGISLFNFQGPLGTLRVPWNNFVIPIRHLCVFIQALVDSADLPVRSLKRPDYYITVSFVCQVLFLWTFCDLFLRRFCLICRLLLGSVGSRWQECYYITTSPFCQYPFSTFIFLRFSLF